VKRTEFTFIASLEKITFRFRQRGASFVPSMTIESIRELLRLNHHVLKHVDATWLREKIQQWVDGQEIDMRPRVHLDEVRRALKQVELEPIKLDRTREYRQLLKSKPTKGGGDG
jgi:hypothetical protein